MGRPLLVVLLALGLSGCASFPPKNPDGSVNVQRLVTWIADGLQSACEGQPTAPACTLGMQAVQILQTKGQDPVVVRATLVELEDRWPAIKAWSHWLVVLLTPKIG